MELRHIWVVGMRLLEDCSIRLRVRVGIILVLFMIHVRVAIHIVIARISIHRHAITIAGHLLVGDHMRGLRLRVHWRSLACLLIGCKLLL